MGHFLWIKNRDSMLVKTFWIKHTHACFISSVWGRLHHCSTAFWKLDFYPASLFPESLHKGHFISVPDPVAKHKDKRNGSSVINNADESNNSESFATLTLSDVSCHLQAFLPETLNDKFSTHISCKRRHRKHLQ